MKSFDGNIMLFPSNSDAAYILECRMKIVLIRHGMPQIDKNRRLSAAEFGLWVSKYDVTGIDAGYPPPQDAVEIAKQCAFAVCSDLPRSIESAAALGLVNIDACESKFREVEMPYANWRFLRLSPAAWSIVFRLMWVIGYSNNAESFSVGKSRAHQCTDRLVALATKYGSVIFVGHGSLNWLISRNLKSMGWDAPPHTPRKHWEYGVYRYQIGSQ